MLETHGKMANSHAHAHSRAHARGVLAVMKKKQKRTAIDRAPLVQAPCRRGLSVERETSPVARLEYLNYFSPGESHHVAMMKAENRVLKVLTLLHH